VDRFCSRAQPHSVYMSARGGGCPLRLSNSWLEHQLLSSHAVFQRTGYSSEDTGSRPFERCRIRAVALTESRNNFHAHGGAQGKLRITLRLYQNTKSNKNVQITKMPVACTQMYNHTDDRRSGHPVVPHWQHILISID